MDFTFSDDQFAFRDAVSRFLMTEAAPETLRDIWETESGRNDELLGKIAAQGLTALSVPEAEGGLGQNDIDWALLSQEVGYYALPDSITESACVGVAVLAALPAGHALRSAWLPRVADGSARIGLAHPVNPWLADAAETTVVLAAAVPKRPGLADISAALQERFIVGANALACYGALGIAAARNALELFDVPAERRAVQELYDCSQLQLIRQRDIRIRSRRGGAKPSDMLPFTFINLAQ